MEHRSKFIVDIEVIQRKIERHVLLPGAILRGPQREYCRTWPNQTEVTVPGIHFLQADSPDQIAEAIRDFL